MNPLLRAFITEIKQFCSSNIALKYIDESFSKAGFIKSIDSNTRWGLVEEYCKNVDWQEKSTIIRLQQAIINLLKTPYLSDDSKEDLLNACRGLDFNIETPEEFYLKANRFARQFPAGLPFGKIKPNFAVKAEQGSQSLKFEWQEGIGIIKDNVYPNFTFKNLSDMFGCTPETDESLKEALVSMNQTPCEKTFFLAYARGFEMATKDMPVLIPQAWIQWHSLIKNKLNHENILQKNDIYRVDFVAFWNNKRFAIQVDDIGHYATHNQEFNIWIANEEAYVKTLKDDRDLKKESWEVLRLSNFEIKDTESLTEALNDVREFLGF